jgi:signal transduction histidine kinase
MSTWAGRDGQRMQIIGGTLQIRSAAGQGTTVIATTER